MMTSLLFNILKKLAPVLLIAGLFIAVYWQGYHSSEKHWIEREAQIKAESNSLIAQAKQRNANIQAQAEQSAKIIGETYEKNHKTITDIVAANTAFVARLRQQSAASSSKSGLPNTARAAKFSNAPDTGNGEFLESFVDQARIADEVTETARSCQQFVKNTQEIFNGTTGFIHYTDR